VSFRCAPDDHNADLISLRIDKASVNSHSVNFTQGLCVAASEIVVRKGPVQRNRYSRLTCKDQSPAMSIDASALLSIISRSGLDQVLFPGSKTQWCMYARSLSNLALISVNLSHMGFKGGDIFSAPSLALTSWIISKHSSSKPTKMA
jgi:hypothetical protein